MSIDTDGHDRFRAHHASAPTRISSVDESYWRAILNEGEVATVDGPPPWIQQTNHADDADSDNGPSAPEQDWERAQHLLAQTQCCELPVTGYNRGGLLVRFGNISGFVPSSHLMGFPVYADNQHREEALERRVGKTARFIVIEIDRLHNRLILSERAALEGKNQEQVLARINPGDVLSGRVSNLRRFGAFVDLGGFEGLIHISEMSWGRVNHPGDVVQPGDEVKVSVLDVNHAERKVQLSLKRLLPDPWQDVTRRYFVGQMVRGEVTNVVSFGAFARIEDGVEGLIHISELAEGNFLHPRNVVCEGQWIEARVLNIDPINRRIGLSLRQINHNHSPRHQV
jgi:small subunit ribosomal protein S1